MDNQLSIRGYTTSSFGSIIFSKQGVKSSFISIFRSFPDRKAGD